jgi:hypothetical protein
MSFITSVGNFLIMFFHSLIAIACLLCGAAADQGEDGGTLVSITDSTDPCTTLSHVMQTPGSLQYGHVKACYQSFPFSNATRQATINTVKTYLNMYVFNEYAKQPPPVSKLRPLFMDQMIQQKLIEPPTFASDWAFQETVANTLSHFNDAHTQYQPNCYRKFIFYQPFFIAGIYAGGREARSVIYRVDKTESDELRELVNMEIIKINGEKAYNVIRRFAKEVYGRSKIQPTRISRTYAFRYWDSDAMEFMFDRGGFSKRNVLPAKDAIEYTLKSIITNEIKVVNVPWRVFATTQMQFTDKASYWNAYCAPKAALQKPVIRTADAVNAADDQMGESRTKVDDAVSSSQLFGRAILNVTINSLDTLVPVTYNGKAYSFKVRNLPPQAPLVVGPGFAFFLFNVHKKRRSGILTISTFQIPNNKVALWYSKMREGFLLFRKLGVKRIMLDLSNNGGGLICLAIALTALLDPDPKVDQTKMLMPRQPYVSAFRMNPLFKKIGDWAVQTNTTTSMFHPSRWIDPSTRMPFTADAWMKETHMEGTKVKYPMSQFLMDSCPMNANDPFQGLKLDLKPKNMAVVSNGYCGSSCAMVSGHLQEVTKVKVIIQVPVRYKLKAVPPPYSFAGGQLITSSRIVEEARQALGDELSTVAPSFPVSAEMLFTFRQIYSRSPSKLPLEYYQEMANVLVLSSPTMIFQTVRTWSASTRMLGWKPDGPYTRCNNVEDKLNIPDRLRICKSKRIFLAWNNKHNIITGVVNSKKGQTSYRKPQAQLKRMLKTAQGIRDEYAKKRRDMAALAANSTTTEQVDDSVE